MVQIYDDWQIKTIGDLGDIITGGTPSSRNPECFGDKYPFITPSDIDGSSRYITTKRFLSEEGKENQIKRILPRGSICFVCIGATIGKICMTKETSFTNQQINSIIVNEHEYNNVFVYYLLCTMSETIKSIASGAATPIVNKSLFSSVNITVPSLSIQNRIAAILSAYDDLIENNLRRIKILEEMAQALYREWFVHFRFSDHEKVRLVDSPLGKIPEGWEASTLGDNIVALESGRRPKGGVTGIAEGIPSIGAENVIGIGKHDFSKERYVPHEFFDSLNKGVVKDGDVALYKDGANIGRSTYFRDGYPYQKCCVNEHVFLIRATGDHLTQNMLYLWLREPETVAQIRSKNTNAAQPGINQKAVRSLRIVVPPKYVVNEFDSLVESILGEIVYLANKNRVLQCTRDLLLPKLISGELDVSELDIALPEDI